MISKKIHYCWFGMNPKPDSVLKCINSWKKNCPDYEIIEWNESNYDINSCDYIKEAYALKKWAFVSDYARLDILNQFGGIYLDTDVELLRPLDNYLDEKGYMGIERITENRAFINPGLGFASEPNSLFLTKLLEKYEEEHYIVNETINNKTIVDYSTELAEKNGLVPKNEIQHILDFTIFPKDYLNPMDLNSGIITITQNTISIHHYDASWVDNYSKFRGKVYQLIFRLFGNKVASCFRKVLGRNNGDN